ncbi:uncharacterized protein CIMG_09699 [Coccidioides immitis RS]|uniref:Uncharacterized protein n=1 Tax=Coccidioides immitis (strain RS) TaxID=246410 RepID=J3K2Y1_COCIM|nr:uncharacterized protein CIMG_09699 [Coccidioides immitis RS]EAS28495.3 hypothetical protein CIMG_09699 [Coccidioides immitis RS]
MTNLLQVISKARQDQQYQARREEETAKSNSRRVASNLDWAEGYLDGGDSHVSPRSHGGLEPIGAALQGILCLQMTKRGGYRGVIPNEREGVSRIVGNGRRIAKLDNSHSGHTYDDTNRKPAASISISVWGLRIGTRWEQGHVPDGGDQIWYIEVHMEESDVRLRIIIVKSTFSSFRDIITKRKLRQELAEVFGWLRRECRQPIVNRPELIDDIETRQHLCNARILPREHTGPRSSHITHSYGETPRPIRPMELGVLIVPKRDIRETQQLEPEQLIKGGLVAAPFVTRHKTDERLPTRGEEIPIPNQMNAQVTVAPVEYRDGAGWRTPPREVDIFNDRKYRD